MNLRHFWISPSPRTLNSLYLCQFLIKSYRFFDYIRISESSKMYSHSLERVEGRVRQLFEKSKRLNPHIWRLSCSHSIRTHTWKLYRFFKFQHRSRSKIWWYVHITLPNQHILYQNEFKVIILHPTFSDFESKYNRGNKGTFRNSNRKNIFNFSTCSNRCRSVNGSIKLKISKRRIEWRKKKNGY